MLLTIAACKSDEKYQFASPDGHIAVQLMEKEGELLFQQRYGSDTIIGFSTLGLTVDGKDFSTGMTIKAIDSTTFDETWQTINEKFPQVRNHYNQYNVALSKADAAGYAYHIIFRLYDDGFTYGLNTTSHKRLIDFASQNNVQYLLIDADWYGAEFSAASDPTQAREGLNIMEEMAYAKARNVGIILYLNDVGANKFGLERVLKRIPERHHGQRRPSAATGQILLRLLTVGSLSH